MQIKKGLCIYDVEREEYDDHIAINVYKTNKRSRPVNGNKSPNRSRYIGIEYKNIGVEYKSQYLSWYNWFFCSKWQIGITDDLYLSTAVQKGLKTTAIVLHLTSRSRQWLRYRRHLEHLPDSCAFKKYGNGGFYIYHKGTIDSFFDMEKIRYIYEAHGLGDLNWDCINSMSKIDLSSFGDYETEPFEPYCPFTKEQYVVNGLLLGYPVESTISLLNTATNRC